MAPLHRHRRDDEAWYVLEGALTVLAGDKRLTARAGGAIVVPAGTAHTFGNPGPGPCRYLIVMTPRVAALIDALHALPAGLDRAERRARVAEVFADHDSEVVGG